VLVEAEHLAMEEIMASVGESDTQPPVAVVCQQHLETVLQRVLPSVKVQLYFISHLFHCCCDALGHASQLFLCRDFCYTKPNLA